MTRLEVWGDPISHSRSPQLHNAAYRTLGLDWAYDRRQVSEATFDRELVSARGELRGLSITMPLKECAHRVATWRDPRALRTGVANTLLLSDDGPRAFNTDIGGLVAALRENGVEAPTTARLIGAGATAVSAVVAFAELGVRSLEIVARTPHKALALAEQASDFGMHPTIRALDDLAGLTPVEATIATLPGGVPLDDDIAGALAETAGSIVDVVYSPWPTSLAAAATSIGTPVAGGLDMLLHQAVLQVRVFVSGQVNESLDDEDVMLAEMRSALMGD